MLPIGRPCESLGDEARQSPGHVDRALVKALLHLHAGNLLVEILSPKHAAVALAAAQRVDRPAPGAPSREQQVAVDADVVERGIVEAVDAVPAVDAAARPARAERP